MANIQTVQRGWIGFDRHFPENDPIIDEIVTEFLEDFKPHYRIAGGDFMNVDQASNFKSESESKLSDEFEQTEAILDKWKITHFFEGNHEQRLRRIGGQVDKRIRDLLDLQRNLHLKQRGIQFIPYHPERGVLQIGLLKILHGFYTTEWVCRKMAETYGTCVFGHAHRFQIFQPASAFETRVGFSIGMLGNTHQSYIESRAPTGWSQGFAFFYLHRNGWWDLYPVRINNGRVCINGKIYGAGKKS